MSIEEQEDNDKMVSLLADLEMLKVRYTFKSQKYKYVGLQVNGLITKIVDYTTNKMKQ